MIIYNTPKSMQFAITYQSSLFKILCGGCITIGNTAMDGLCTAPAYMSYDGSYMTELSYHVGVLPDAEVVADSVLLEDAADVVRVDGGDACLGQQLVRDPAHLLVGVAAGDVDGNLLLGPPRRVCIALNLGREMNTSKYVYRIGE
jgi:hypothetical protein